MHSAIYEMRNGICIDSETLENIYKGFNEVLRKNLNENLCTIEVFDFILSEYKDELRTKRVELINIFDTRIRNVMIEEVEEWNKK